MEVEKIVILASEADLEKAEKVIETIEQIIKSAIVGKIIYGRLGYNILISFNVEKPYYHQFCEKLYLNKITIVTNQSNIDSKKITPYRPQKSKPISKGWDEVRKTLDYDLPIENLIQAGNYKEIINITKDIRNGQKNIDAAYKAIPEAINITIEKAVSDFKKFESRKKQAISTLLEISSDHSLKTTRFTEVTKRSALTAVELCATDKSELTYLIDLGNNYKIHWIGPIKALAKFAEFVLSDKTKYKSDIEYAIKNLNLRWIDICMQMVEHEINETERKQIDLLIELIKSVR